MTLSGFVLVIILSQMISLVLSQQLSPPDNFPKKIHIPDRRSNIRKQSSLDNSLNITLPKTLFIFIAIHPFNKLKYLPYVLGGLEKQIYQKKRIRLLIHTEQLLVSKHCREKDKIEIEFDRVCQEQSLNAKTLKAIRTWVASNEIYYSNIDLKIDLVSQDASNEQHFGHFYWSDSRFKRLALMKENAFDMAKENWADFILNIDADIILTNPKTFEYFLKDSHSLIAPVLSSVDIFSNFWAGMSDDGYYKRTDEYFKYLYRETMGNFEVPMIHSCVFINLRRKDTSQYLTYLPKDDNRNFDDMLSLQSSAKSNNISMYVDNTEKWGYLPPLIDDDLYTEVDRIQDHHLNDLRLLALYEQADYDDTKFDNGLTDQLPIASSLLYLNEDEKLDLGVDHVYVINLPSRRARRELITEATRILGIEVEFFNGSIDGNQEKYEMFNRFNLTVMPNYRDPIKNRTMTFGEIGCFLSHYKIWKDMIENNYQDAIIFEDDVRFEVNLVNKWKDILHNEISNQQQYDFVFLGRKKLYTSEDTFVSEHLAKPGYSWWLVGYMITKEGAKKLIDAKPLDNLLPSDEFLPIMYDKHPNYNYTRFYPDRNLVALSIEPPLVWPQYYIGDQVYTSDTELSEAVDVDIDDINSSSTKEQPCLLDCTDSRKNRQEL